MKATKLSIKSILKQNRNSTKSRLYFIKSKLRLIESKLYFIKLRLYFIKSRLYFIKSKPNLIESRLYFIKLRLNRIETLLHKIYCWVYFIKSRLNKFDISVNIYILNLALHHQQPRRNLETSFPLFPQSNSIARFAIHPDRRKLLLETVRKVQSKWKICHFQTRIYRNKSWIYCQVIGDWWVLVKKNIKNVELIK